MSATMAFHGIPVRANCSVSASDTNFRSGIPCSAAANFARLKSSSGISKVVFIKRHWPIFIGARTVDYPLRAGHGRAYRYART